MNVDEALRQLSVADTFPRETLQWSLDHWDEASPRYLSKLRAAAGRGKPDKDDADALFSIVHLFGEKRDSRGYAPLCDLIASDPEIETWLGDGVAETLPGLLINMFDGDPEPLHQAIEAVGADEFARGSALGALSYLVRKGQTPGEQEFLDYLLQLLRESGPRGESYFWTAWANTAGRMGYAALGPDVARLLSKHWINREQMTIEDFHADIADSKSESSATAMFERLNIEPFSSTVETLANWTGYSGQSEADRNEQIDFGDALEIISRVSGQSPYVNANRDIGRNDPCPCLSGKKYKKCCLAA